MFRSWMNIECVCRCRRPNDERTKTNGFRIVRCWSAENGVSAVFCNYSHFAVASKCCQRNAAAAPAEGGREIVRNCGTGLETTEWTLTEDLQLFLLFSFHFGYTTVAPLNAAVPRGSGEQNVLCFGNEGMGERS